MKTSNSTPAQVVQQIYADFGSGNIPNIIDNLADDIEWTDAGHVADLYIGTRKGKPAVLDFFQKLMRYLSVSKFEIKDFFPAGNKVAVTGHIAGKANATGLPYGVDWAMTWEINEQGKVIRHQLYLDTDNIAKAIAG